MPRPRLLLLLTALLALAASARAADHPRLATIDMKRVFEEFWKYAESKELLDARSRELNQDLDVIEQRYESLMAQIGKLKGELESPAINEQTRLEKGALLDKLAQDLRAIESQVKQRKVELLKLRDAEREKLLKELTVLARNFALKEKIDVILDSSSGATMGPPAAVVYASAALDVTDRLLAVINEGHEKKPAAPAPPAAGSTAPEPVPAGK